MKPYARPMLRDAAKEKLIAEHAGMARRIALRLARRVPSWISKEDLVATAMLGLTEAADRYDEARGEPFVAFAEQRIRGAVLDELRRGDILPRRLRVTARNVGETIRRLEQELQRDPEDDEIAKALGVGVEEYHQELEVLSHVSFVELDEVAVDRSNPEAAESSPYALVEQKELITRVKAAIDKLPERDAMILSLYYVEAFTYVEIGEVLEVSESRVCQLHSRALARLRVELDTKKEDKPRAKKEARLHG
ncbi:RNA polymerase sigma factor FliA [Myxococcota bacterium]|nr:RNA polymerase sigma factor FliA [Myxococcota bacterium]